MAVNFEEKLAEASSAETLKGAKQLLKNGTLECAFRDEKDNLKAAFTGKDSCVRTTIKTGPQSTAECSGCSGVDGKLCAHAVAAIMHCGAFKNELKPLDDGLSKYAGMRFVPMDELARKALPQEPEAELRMEVHSDFPHVPSKWENSVINIKLHTANRDYLGNLNNVRQLYFEKSLTVSLRLDQFSLQDQQILRYLATNGEADGSNILLDSEQTAEFFHNLIGFNRFTRDGRRIVIHRETAEPVIIKSIRNQVPVIAPGIKVGTSLLPLPLARVITGRSGCWVGKQGEYFFIPAQQELGWVRNFFRSGVQELKAELQDTFTLNGRFPVPIVSSEQLDIELKRNTVVLSGDLESDGDFRLEVRYVYNNQVFEANTDRLGRDGKNFFRRDEESERAFEQELSMFGFSVRSGVFHLNKLESIGIFLNEVLPMWFKKRPDLVIGTQLAALCRGGAGLPDANMTCRIADRGFDHYVLSYDLRAGGRSVRFRDLAGVAAEGKSYALCEDSIVHIDSEFRDFLISAGTVIRHLDETKRTFELPFFSVKYWAHIGEGFPGMVPGEFIGATAEKAAADNSAKLSGSFKGKLRLYQQQGVEWLQQHTDNDFNVILADEMGLGKTVQLLAFLATRKRVNMPAALVICPASLVTNWTREAAKFVPNFRVGDLSGSGRELIWDNLNDYDLLVTSYATSCRDAELMQKHEFSYLILDEAQHIKNPGTVNAQNCKAVRAAHKIVLTGTPLENSCEDLWSIFDFLHHGMLGSFAAFRKHYADLSKDHKLQSDLSARVSPFIKRRTKAQVGQELPPKQEHSLFCDMSDRQRKLYEDIREQGRRQLAELGDSDKLGTEIFVTLLRLRQICCHPSLLPDCDDLSMPSAKFDLLKELIHENIDSGHKMLLFSQFTSVLAVIQEYLDLRKIKYEYLDGATRNRQQRVDKFNSNPDIPIFLLSLKAGGTGLNLTSADTVIIYDPWWNPAVELQATDRTHRIGQTRPVTSLKLIVKDSIEEKILSLQKNKQELFDSVIDNPNSYSDKLSLDELRFLLN